MNKLLCMCSLILSVNACWALRCQGQLVYVGDKQDVVERKCGEPKSKETLSTTQAIYNGAGVQVGSAPFLTEVWTYQASPQDFIHKVYFTEKVVTSINEYLQSPGER